MQGERRRFIAPERPILPGVRPSLCLQGSTMTTDSDAPGQPVGIRDVAKARRRLRRHGQPGHQRPAGRGRGNQASHPGRGRAARLPRQPAGAGAAAGAHHDLRLRGAQLRQPVLPRGAQRGSAGRGRLGSDAAGPGLALLAGARAPARAGTGGPAGGGLAIAPVGHRRVDPALAGAAPGGPGGRAERGGGRHHRRLPGQPGQRRRGRAADAPAGRARPQSRRVPVGAAPA